MTSAAAHPRARPRVTAWVIGVLVAGICAGLAGMLMTLVLHGVQRLAFAQDHDTIAAAIRHAPPWRRALAPIVGGILAGGGWWWLRRRRSVPPLSRAADGRLSFHALGVTLGDALLQVVAVGSGASIGRETAPRQTAAAFTSKALHHVPPDVRRILVAAAAGGGLAAVYSTPIAGALFAVEITLGGLGVRALLPALAVSAIATVAASPVTGGLPVYPVHGLTPRPGDVLAGVVVLAASLPCALVFTWLMERAKKQQPTGPRLLTSLTLAGAVLGLSSLAFPQLPGNGKALVEDVMAGRSAWAVLAALVVLKPLLTAAFLRAGASGGLLTPAVATGAGLGAVMAAGFHGLGVPVQTNVLVLLAAAGFLAVSQRAPWFAAVFVWELTTPSFVLLPLLLAGSYACQVMARKSYETLKLPAPNAT